MFASYTDIPLNILTYNIKTETEKVFSKSIVKIFKLFRIPYAINYYNTDSVIIVLVTRFKFYSTIIYALCKTGFKLDDISRNTYVYSLIAVVTYSTDTSNRCAVDTGVFVVLSTNLQELCLYRIPQNYQSKQVNMIKGD